MGSHLHQPVRDPGSSCVEAPGTAMVAAARRRPTGSCRSGLGGSSQDYSWKKKATNLLISPSDVTGERHRLLVVGLIDPVGHDVLALEEATVHFIEATPGRPPAANWSLEKSCFQMYKGALWVSSRLA